MEVNYAAGADPDIEEGEGIHRVSLVRPCGAHSQHGFFACACNTKCGRGVWGHAPPGKFLNLDHMRMLLRPSETTITTLNLWQLDFNLGTNRMVVSQSNSESTTVCEVLPRLSLGSCRFECFMFTGHEAVIYMEICTVSE